MSRIITATARLAAVAATIILAIYLVAGTVRTDAQTPSTVTAEHTLSGSWLSTGGDPEFAGALFSFTTDGIVLVSGPDGQTAHGTWMPDGERQNAFTFVEVNSDSAGRLAEIVKFEGTLEVNAAGEMWRGAYMVERTAPGQSAAFSASPLASIEAARIPVEDDTAETPKPGEAGSESTPAL